MTGPIQEAAATVYREGDWPVTELEDGSGFTVYVEGSAGDWSAIVLTDDEGLTFVFYSLAPVDATEETMAAFSEFCHRANNGLLTGTFELDHDTGEVRLRTGIDLATLPRSILDDAGLLQAIVLDLSAANVEIFDRYLSGLVAIAVGGVDVAEVIGEIESAPVD